MSSSNVVLLKRTELELPCEWYIHFDQYLEQQTNTREERNAFEAIVGSSPALRSVLNQVRTVAPTDSTVLIEGETRSWRANTNQELSERVTRNEFRTDLYYRFNVFSIVVPSLRQRPEDFPLLVVHFIAKYAKRMSKHISKISRDAMCALMRHPWPGNVRELQNFIERAVILTDGDILQIPSPPSGLPSRPAIMTLAEAQREYIL